MKSANILNFQPRSIGTLMQTHPQEVKNAITAAFAAVVEEYGLDYVAKAIGNVPLAVEQLDKAA